MKEIIRLMKERKVLLKKAIARAERDKESFPEGNLRVSCSNGRPRYYKIKQKGDKKGEYIKRTMLSEAAVLAQKDYNKQFLKIAKTEVNRLEKDIRIFSGENADLYLEKLALERKSLVKPYIPTDEQYAMEWQNKDYKTNPCLPEKRIYGTKRGELVRSKSEAILADMLYEFGIPYHYEKPLRLKSGRIIYPDFTLLQVKERREIYLEHFGLLDDEEYLNKSLEKLDEYRGSGIYPGKNLIFTYETENSALDIRGIRKMINELLLETKDH